MFLDPSRGLIARCGIRRFNVRMFNWHTQLTGRYGGMTERSMARCAVESPRISRDAGDILMNVRPPR